MLGVYASSVATYGAECLLCAPPQLKSERARESERSMLRSDGLRRVTTIGAALLVAALMAVLVLWEAKPAEATFPGTTNGKIVFDSPRDTGTGVTNPEGDSEIFTMNADGTGLTQLTSNAANDGNAAWAPIPNEDKIVFHSRRETATNPDPDGSGPQLPDFEIYVMDGDEPENTTTNVAVQLTNNTARDTNPTWSPDGARIAFTSDRGLGGNEDIYVMNAVDTNGDSNGENLVRLTKHAADDDNPDWSPNGTRIAFDSYRADEMAAEIFVMKPRPEGKRNRPVNLTRTNSGDDIEPSWSPEGTEIAFARSRASLFSDSEVGSLVYEIYTMRADGTNQFPQTENEEDSNAPVWSPDGSKIAFMRSVGGAGSNDFDIFVMSSGGSIPDNITDGTNFDADSFDSDPDWQALP
jgi:Tol biopolymer transport system component